MGVRPLNEPHVLTIDSDVHIGCPSGVAMVHTHRHCRKMSLIGCHLHDGLAGESPGACVSPQQIDLPQEGMRAWGCSCCKGICVPMTGQCWGPAGDRAPAGLVWRTLHRQTWCMQQGCLACGAMPIASGKASVTSAPASAGAGCAMQLA